MQNVNDLLKKMENKDYVLDMIQRAKERAASDEHILDISAKVYKWFKQNKEQLKLHHKAMRDAELWILVKSISKSLEDYQVKLIIDKIRKL